MYLKIEQSFKKKSHLRKSKALFFGVYFFFAFLLIYLGFIEKIININMLVVVLIYGCIYHICAYFYVIVKIRKCKEFSWKKLLDTDENVKLYRLKIHNQDIRLLQEILTEHKIDNANKMQEAIRHYQTLMPRNIITGSSILSIMAFVIAIITLFLNEKIYDDKQSLEITFMFLLVVFLIVFTFNLYNKNIFRLFGKVELYKRLETSISEIYMNLEESPTKDETPEVKAKNCVCKHKKIKSYSVSIKINHK